MKLTPLNVTIFVLVSLLSLSGIVFARVGPSWNRWVGHWEETPVVCAELGVNEAELLRAVAWFEEQGIPFELSCQGATVLVRVDPTIDTRDSVDDVGTTHGVTGLVFADESAEDPVIVAAIVRVLPGSPAIVYAHELFHVIGGAHPLFPFTGTIGHPHRPGWDCRGCVRQP